MKSAASYRGVEMKLLAFKLFRLMIVLMAWLPAGSQAIDLSEHQVGSLIREQAVVPAGKVIDRDYVVYGQIVQISGTVNGDVYAAGGQVLIDGKINGDLLAAGGTVTISGTVAQDARLVGGKVAVSGVIGRNVTAAGGNVELTSSATIQGGMIAGGGNIHIAAPVTRDAKIGARNILVSSPVGGNLTAAAETIRLTSQAVVGGNVVYWSRNPASVDDHATVSGKLIRRELPQAFLSSPEDFFLAIVGLKLGVMVASFVSTLILGLLLIRYYPVSTQQALLHLGQRPFASLGVGILALILIPLLAGFLAATVVGIPLAFIVLAWYLILLYVCRIVVILWAGLLLFRNFGKGEHVRLAFVVGLLLYVLLTLVPILSAWLTVLVIMFGLGTVLLAKRDAYRAARYQDLV
jgi:cytoskeletal protein CcmA (bactofilin family)